MQYMSFRTCVVGICCALTCLRAHDCSCDLLLLCIVAVHVVQAAGLKGFDKPKLEKCLTDIKFAYSYPRLDVDVTKKMNHLLKVQGEEDVSQQQHIVHVDRGTRQCSVCLEQLQLIVPSLISYVENIGNW